MENRGRQAKWRCERCAAFALALALAFPAAAQQRTDAPDAGNAPAPAAARERQQTAAGQDTHDKGSETGRQAPADDAGRRPPNASWHAPFAGLADLLGITALMALFGVTGPVASAIGGIAVSLAGIAILFAAWWYLVRRYRIAGARAGSAIDARRPRPHS